MTEPTSYKTVLDEFYELHHEEQTAVSGTVITVTGHKPHADVIATTGHKLERTRVYVNNVRNMVTKVELAVNDTDITVADTITSGDVVEIYLAPTDGTLSNNGSLGKIPLIEPQIAENYSVESNTFEQRSHGTTRTEIIKLSSRGRGTLVLARRGDTDLENFMLARKNKRFLMIIVKDIADSANTTYDVLHEVRLLGYGASDQAQNNESGIAAVVAPFRFVPNVPMTT